MLNTYEPGKGREIWLRYIDAWNRHNVNEILDCVDVDFTYDECPMTMEQPLRGRNTFEIYLTNVFRTLPDLHIELLTVAEGNDNCWSESIMRGHFVKRFLMLPPFIATVATRIACAFTVGNGVLTGERLYWDKANTLRQFGILASLFGVISKPVWHPGQTKFNTKC